ncbi:MAG: hypothetical protein PHP69_06575, partial [Candidatus Omnitrophica bacterium]|nr:hypothetical protein [Candidatus Omnitrophota bacterium]
IVQLICILPLAHSIEMGFSARRIFDLAGPLSLFLYSLRNLLIEFFSFPCDIFFSDISYLVLHKVSIYGNILLTVFFLYPAVIIFRIFRKKEAGDIFLISIYFSALTFLFIVIYSRNNVYAITQPRYLYFPAGLMIILLFNIADELLTLLKNKRIFLYPFMIVLAGCFLFSIISNAFKINSTANEVSYIMRPVAIAFDNIKDFLMVSEEKSLNLFVENFDLTRGDKLFLGTQLAVGVYGGNDINVTRDYYDAQYILTPAGIVKNKDYAYLGGSDFTMEFDVQFRDLENGDSKVLFKSKNSAILVSKLNDVDILTFAGRGPSGAEEFIVSQGLTPSWFKETRHYHIVIQREDDHVALIVDGIFIDRWPLKDIEFSFKDADVPFNKRPYYLERNDLYIAIENFYASFGKKIYDLSGFKTGSKTPYTSGVKALGSVIENFFDVSAMHLTNNQKIELVLTEYDVSEIKSFLNVYNN